MSGFDPASFANVNVVAGAVIFQDGKILLVQEAWEKVRGQWNLPAGRVDKGETIEQAAIREVKEETNLSVKLGQHLITVHQSIESPVLHAFLVTEFSGDVTYNKEEMLDARWFESNEILTMGGLRNEEYIRGAVKAALDVIK